MVQESVKQTSIPFRQKKITQHKVSNAKDPNSTQKLEAVAVKAGISAIESPTPQRPGSKSRLNTGVGNSNIEGKQLLKDFEGDINSSCDKICTVEDDSIELPDEYKTLNILFEKMDTSIRLLALRKKLPTFRNISVQVEKLSKRKFLSSHLAQMKYLLPESIEIERILIHDEKTLCMIPQIKVILVKDIKSCVDADQSASISLCRVFQSELLKYFKTHVQNIEIPKAMLPEPFNEGKNIVQKISPEVSVEVPLQKISTEQEVVARASHISSSFEEHFIHKMIPEKITPPSTVEENKESINISEDKPNQRSTSHMTSQIPVGTSTKKVKSEENKNCAFPTNLLMSIVDTIFFIMRSTDCSLITKQELMQKIIANNFDIEDSGEVEENLLLLEKLVPDWMTKRSSSDGDSLYSIEKDYDGETVRAKAFEAVCAACFGSITKLFAI